MVHHYIRTKCIHIIGDAGIVAADDGLMKAIIDPRYDSANPFRRGMIEPIFPYQRILSQTEFLRERGGCHAGAESGTADDDIGLVTGSPEPGRHLRCISDTPFIQGPFEIRHTRDRPAALGVTYDKQGFHAQYPRRFFPSR